MKKFLLAAVGLMAIAAPAAAADLGRQMYTKAPPVPYYAPVYNWTGFYVGGHIGGAWADRGGAFGSSDGRFLGGVQGGADYQFAPNWLVGIEGQYSWLNSGNNSFAFPGGTVTDNKRGLGSVTGRVGWTWGPGLLYVKGGYGFADDSIAVRSVAGTPLAYATSGRRTDGATVGAGFEYMFAPNWSAKGEYQYYNFGRTAFVAGSPAALVGASYRNDEHTFKAGLNYRFNWGAPVAARY